MIYVHPQKIQYLEDCENFKDLAKKVVTKSERGDHTVKYLARNGLTPPTKDIRNRFFRKEFPVPKEEISKIEKEMVKVLKEMKEKKDDTKSVKSKSKKAQ